MYGNVADFTVRQLGRKLALAEQALHRTSLTLDSLQVCLSALSIHFTRVPQDDCLYFETSCAVRKVGTSRDQTHQRPECKYTAACSCFCVLVCLCKMCVEPQEERRDMRRAHACPLNM